MFSQKYLKHLKPNSTLIAHSSFIWWVPQTSKTLTKRPIQHPSAKWVSLQPSKCNLSHGTTENLRPLNFQGPKLQKHIVGYLYIYNYIYTIIYAVYQHIPLYPHDILRVCPSLDGIFHSKIDQQPKTVKTCLPSHAIHVEKRIFPWFSYGIPTDFPMSPMVFPMGKPCDFAVPRGFCGSHRCVSSRWECTRWPPRFASLPVLQCGTPQL